VRVGLEDNLYMPDGSLASNPRLVEKVVAIAKEIGREIANSEEARICFSMNPQFKDRILT
jgi:3-keto-5-aminohexanoate cleavage enzyme